MAVTPSTITELNDLAKDYFSNVYQPLMNTETPLKAQFARLENAQFTGKKWIFGTKTATGGAAANAGANKSLPAADVGKYDQGEATLIRTYTRMALDNLAIEVTKMQQGSYRPAVAETMADRLDAHDLEVNRQMFCGGDGKVALVSAGATSSTQTFGSDYGVTNGGAGVRHVNVGDAIQFYDTTGATLRAGGPFTVTSVNTSANTAVLSGAPATTTGDFATKATADTDNKTAGEAQGLLASVATTAAFEQITHNRWQSTVDSNGGTLRDLTDSILIKNIATIRSASRKIPNLAVCRPGVVLKYSETFLPLRRIMGQDIKLQGGYVPVTGLQHAGGVIPVLEDLDCPESRLFLLNTEAFRMADLVGSEWFDGDGASFSRVVDKDSVEGFIRKYWQLITIQRNANGVITDLNDYSAIQR